MSSIPEWPESDGPRVLTLVGNDLSIDIRARKTASSLARAGYSVIALGIDQAGGQERSEMLDGALIWRVIPSIDPRVSTRSIRMSRAELRDSLRFRLENRRQRLQLRRRTFTAARHWRSREDPAWVERVASWLAAFASQPTRDQVRSGVKRRLRVIDKLIRFGPRRARLKVEQRSTHALRIAYKALARPSARSPRSANWRRDLPELHRYEAAMGPIVDSLQPDLIHVHDVFHIGIAARAKARAQHDGRDIVVLYDAHEFVPGLPGDPRRRAALADLEEEYIHKADAVVTVSDLMAEAITKRHGVSAEVVMNAPDMETAVKVTPLRSVCGIGEGVPLATYVGGIAPHRGAELMIEALASLDGVHLALVIGEVTAYIQGLLDTAAKMGLADRLHVTPFVAPEGVVSYIESADVSLIPLSREVANYEVTLPNKLFQSIQAGVPVVVSDNPAMAEFVQKHQIGEVFEGGNPQALASAVRKVLENPDLYRDPLRDEELLRATSWSAQIERLLTVHRGLGIGRHA